MSSIYVVELWRKLRFVCQLANSRMNLKWLNVSQVCFSRFGALCLKWCSSWDLMVAIVVSESDSQQMVSPTISRINHTRFGYIFLCLNCSLIQTIGPKMIDGVVP